jgi:uroporphyrinogen-III synthase
MRGLRVGVTAGRKGAELTAALERRGALPRWGPCVGGDRAEPDEAILAQTDAVLAARPRWVAASTGVGMRLWAEVAERHGRLEELRTVLSGARRLARGPKAVGGMRTAFGVDPEWVAADETDSEVAERLLASAQAGESVAVQLHGGPSRAYGPLARAGIELLSVLPYRSVLPEDTGPALELVRSVLDGGIDLLVFTSPGAAHNLLILAEDLGSDVPGRLREAVEGGVAVAAVGPVTAGACRQEGLGVTLTPRRFRTGDLLREIDAWSSATDPDPAPDAARQPRR